MHRGLKIPGRWPRKVVRRVCHVHPKIWFEQYHGINTYIYNYMDVYIYRLIYYGYTVIMQYYVYNTLLYMHIYNDMYMCLDITDNNWLNNCVYVNYAYTRYHPTCSLAASRLKAETLAVPTELALCVTRKKLVAQRRKPEQERHSAQLPRRKQRLIMWDLSPAQHHQKKMQGDPCCIVPQISWYKLEELSR